MLTLMSTGSYSIYFHQEVTVHISIFLNKNFYHFWIKNSWFARRTISRGPSAAAELSRGYKRVQTPLEYNGTRGAASILNEVMHIHSLFVTYTSMLNVSTRIASI